MATSVDCLIGYPFLYLPLAAKIIVLQNGRPRPPLSLRVSNCDASQFHAFELSEYDRVQWLTGCDRRKRLFCWPCLLFCPPNPWNREGVDGQLFRQRIQVHEADLTHIKGLLTMQLFINSIFSKNPISKVTFNSLVKRNRAVLKRVIDTVSFLVLQKRPAGKESQDKNHLSRQECAEALTFLQKHGVSDGEDVRIAEDAFVVLQNSGGLINHIVDAISECVKSSIKRETKASTFVSIILSGHGTDASFVRRSVVLRYLKNYKVCERFVGFYQVQKASSNAIYEDISKVVSEFQLSQRVLSLSIDGSFPKPVVDAIKTELPSIYPYAAFVPCYFHKFRDVLQQSVSVFNECDTFFKMMAEILAFFQKDPNDLKCFLEGKVFGSVAFGSVNTPGTLNLVKRLRKPLIDYFDFIVKNCVTRKRDDCMKAFAYREFLSKFSSVFWLEFFIRLFRLANNICEILDSSMPETAFEKDDATILKLSTALANEKKLGFNHFWNGIMDYLKEDLQNQILNIDKHQWRERFQDVVNCAHYHVQMRLEHLNNLEFFHLLNPSKFNPIFSIPYHAVTQLNDLYGYAFVSMYVKVELRKLYPNNKSLIGYSVEELLEYLNSDCRKPNFTYLIKLAKLVLTMPCKRPADTHSSMLDKISAFSPCSTTLSGDYSLLCIEPELFREIRRQNSFHDDVITEFQKLDNTVEWLHFKT